MVCVLYTYYMVVYRIAQFTIKNEKIIFYNLVSILSLFSDKFFVEFLFLIKLKSLILAQNERWRHASDMQVERDLRI